MVHGRAGGLHHENVPATHVLTNFNHNLTVAEGLNYCLTLGNLKMLADLSRQLRIGITAKKFQSVQHKEKPKSSILSADIVYTTLLVSRLVVSKVCATELVISSLWQSKSWAARASFSE